MFKDFRFSHTISQISKVVKMHTNLPYASKSKCKSHTIVTFFEIANFSCINSVKFFNRILWQIENVDKVTPHSPPWEYLIFALHVTAIFTSITYVTYMCTYDMCPESFFRGNWSQIPWNSILYHFASSRDRQILKILFNSGLFGFASTGSFLIVAITSTYSKLFFKVLISNLLIIHEL